MFDVPKYSRSPGSDHFPARFLEQQYHSLKPSNLSSTNRTAINDLIRKYGDDIIPWANLASLLHPRRQSHQPSRNHLPPPIAQERDIRKFLQELEPHQDCHLRKTLEDSLQVTHRPGRYVMVHPENWTTRGLWQQTAGQTAANWVREHWTGPKKLPRQQALASMALRGLRHSRDSMLNTEQQKSHQLRQALRTLFDPRTIALAQTVTGTEPVTLAQYNIATIGQQAISDLMEHNPGALAWAMLRLSPRAQVNHPGQLVQAARKNLQEAGMDPAHWRVARKLSTHAMKKILDLPQWAQPQAISLLAQAAIHPDDQSVSLAAQLTRHLSAKTNQRPRRATNLARLLRLHNDPQQQGEPWQETLDYVLHLSATGETLNSRTFKGLQKKAARWHQEMTDHRLQNQWNAMLSEREGWIHSWNSLIPQTQVDDLTFTPLTDERQLLQESLRMAHCVFSYGPRAAEGKSRLFSISRNHQHVATLEITPKGNSWQASQIRAYRNHPAEPQTDSASEELARQYTHAWSKNPKHQSRRSRYNENETS